MVLKNIFAEFKKRKSDWFLGVIIYSTIFGFIAGIVGGIFVDGYFDHKSNGVLNIPAEVTPELKKVKTVVVTQQDFEVNKIIEQNESAVVGIYLKKKTTSDPIASVYLPREQKGNAVVLTSDGWLLSHQSVVGSFVPSQLAAIYKNKVLPVEKIINDGLTGLVFIKVLSDNLPAVSFGDSDSLNIGQFSLAINSFGNAGMANVKDTDFREFSSAQSLILSTEVLSGSILLSGLVDQSFLGSPVFNLAGSVVGVIKKIDTTKNLATVVPANYFRFKITSVLQQQNLKRPYLGIKYLDLASSRGLTVENLNRGALVVNSPEKLSPAAAAGILDNDLILKVEKETINENSDLAYLIQQYQPGDKIKLEILRAGKGLEVEVTLAAMP